MIEKHELLRGIIEADDSLVRVFDVEEFVRQQQANPGGMINESGGIVGDLIFDGDQYYDVLDSDVDPAVHKVARRFEIENVMYIMNGRYQPVLIIH